MHATGTAHSMIADYHRDDDYPREGGGDGHERPEEENV
jgi:hypothetical protein